MPPARIVSLVPSLTELVWWLGAGHALVGRTRFCTEPAGEIDSLPIMGGTKNPHMDRIVAAAPDLVIANKEENRREDVEALGHAGLNVLLTDPNTVEEALTMVQQLGAVLGLEARAAELVDDVRAALAEPAPRTQPRVFVAVWKDPLMGLGSNAYGHDLLQRSGAVNVLGGQARYPEVTRDDVANLHPDLILLPDEPYPFKEADAIEFATIAPATVVDGKLLWWYGPRMPAAIRSLRATFATVSR